MARRGGKALKNLFWALVLLFGSTASAEGKGPGYLYRPTRDLVRFVERAKALVEERGEAAFGEFGKAGGKWIQGDLYLFVYDPEGVCVFHPVEKELVGKKIIDFKDMDGKPVIRFIVEKAMKEGAGWVHYLWARPGAIFPMWKNSYVMKATAPSGKVYIVGSGLYSMKIERRWLVETVDAAVELIREKGEGAFDAFRDEASRYAFSGIYVFVLDEDGTAVVDPAFPSLEGRNLMDLADAGGKTVVREMVEKLKDADSAWVTYLWPRTGEVHPSKKVAYIRKARLGDRTLIVGSDAFLPDPIWLKF